MPPNVIPCPVFISYLDESSLLHSVTCNLTTVLVIIKIFPQVCLSAVFVRWVS